MNGIDKVSRFVDILVGIELTQICVGFSEIILNFGTDDQISIFASSFFEENSDFLSSIFSGDPKCSPFGKKIEHAAVTEEVLRITFSNGSEISLRDDSENFESIRFKVRGVDEVI